MLVASYKSYKSTHAKTESWSTWETSWKPNLACLVFLKSCLVLFWFKEKGKARLGVVDLFFAHIILHTFLLIKACMSCLSIPYYLSYLTFPIREPLSGFWNCFMHIWGIWLDLVSLLFDYFEWHPYAAAYDLIRLSIVHLFNID